MQHIKSHFTFSKKQRNGIFLLLVLIITFQCLYYFSDFSNDEPFKSGSELIAFQNEIDSLKQVKTENSKPKIYPFNPNYITDYKGYTLGMSSEEIDRLLAFRAKDQWVNSAEEFQQVTQVSDSLLEIISPYFKFPEWVTNPKVNKSYNSKTYDNTPKTYNQKIDLNQATASQLQSVYGVGEKLSANIIKYRNQFDGGFASDVELQEVYGLKREVIENITNRFTVKTPRSIQRINLNTATRDQLVTIKYIDYEIAHSIIEERTLREGFKSLDDLTKVKGFPLNKIEIIKLYLMLE
ncbi:competence protein ComEA [Hanstruepera neustonica]|uniref:Competence protein ComEA n=1 Tax=Hanstruepera neustonica TaxID=1445657 RepID=A0A2K1E0A0_9FLAO|nr:helix-hairpin-helix domain-containing protein [Hanstruepera neustonica]PNQ73703.1 competence protein ComEA [Hanstruepera neustonica]